MSANVARQQRFELSDQWRQIYRDYSPDNVVIDVQIVVNNPMPHANDFGPRNVGMGLLNSGRNAPRRIADRLN
jgi:hypothetical protein